MFTQGNTPVVWRGPMLHRALQQFLADVYWGDLDVLLLDLPPGTGDIAISVAQLIPGAEILVVTTPQLAAAEVAERAGAIALQTRQRIVGVVENMSGLMLPDGTDDAAVRRGRRPPGRRAADPGGRRGRAAAGPGAAGSGAGRPRATPGCRWCSQRPDSAAGKELRGIADALSDAASAAWPACRWAWTPPRPLSAARCASAVERRRRVDRRRAASTSTARRRRVARATGGCAGGHCAASPAARRARRLPVRNESSPSSRCLVSAARGVIPRSFCSSLSGCAQIVELRARGPHAAGWSHR